MRDEVEVYAELAHETPDAYLLELPNGKRVWLPKSQCSFDGKVTFTVSEWMATDKELV